MVFAGDHHVPHPGVGCDPHPLGGIEFHRIKLAGQFFIIHSPIPLTGFPFHSPPGIAYRPQWINMPNRASRNHPMRWSCSALASAGIAADTLTDANATKNTLNNKKVNAAIFRQCLGGLIWKGVIRFGFSWNVRGCQVFSLELLKLDRTLSPSILDSPGAMLP